MATELTPKEKEELKRKTNLINFGRPVQKEPDKDPEVLLKKLSRTQIAKILIFLVVIFMPLGCDYSDTPDNSLLLRLQSGYKESISYVMGGGYVDEYAYLKAFVIHNNYLPRTFDGYEVNYFILRFDRDIQSVTLTLNNNPLNAFVMENFDSKKVVVPLYTLLGPTSFIVSGTVTDYLGRSITIKTPVILYQ